MSTTADLADAPDALEALDPLDARRALGAGGLLRAFNQAGVLAAADVHVALALARLGDVDDEVVALGAALAVRAPRFGHVYADLATIRETVMVDAEEEVDLAGLPWPEPGAWARSLQASGLVAVGEGDEGSVRPLRLVGSALYLDRYWREERQVAADLAALGAAPADGVRADVVAEGLSRLFARPGDGDDDRQALAAASAVLRRLAVVAGGPGTGKTTTVARIVALLAEQAAAAGAPDPLFALAAPTGKAAARLGEAVHEEAARLDLADAVRDQLLQTQASTLHRLLGWRPGSHSRFRHHRGNRLPHDVVVVDETSMVSLSLMARLVEAIRPQARLVLLGDPGQLTSIEAGAVLGDIVGPATAGPLLAPPARAALEDVAGHAVAAGVPPPGAKVADGIVVLARGHRFGGAIAELADAVRRGDADAAVATLSGPEEELEWIAADPGDARAAGAGAVAAVRDGAVEAARRVIEAARGGDAAGALAALPSFRVLCAHRRGPHGVATWMDRIERWLAAEIEGFGDEGQWYVGRPLLVTQNDYGLRLYNGDTGVVVASGAGRPTAAFERRGEIARISPTRLGAVDTVYAMTIHKSQGSQFDTAAVLLPDPASRILTRELLYTAVTRARKRLIVVGAQETILAAVARPVARASGLRWRLWGGAPPASPAR